MLLSCKKYGKPADMWSIGCIFAEILGRKPIFPGKDTWNQLELILDTIGTPIEQEIEAVSKSDSKSFLRSLEEKPGIDF